MPKVFTSKTQRIGEIGEEMAVLWLTRRGFTIIDRNYTRPWGEIDIVAKKGNKYYFFEVKAVVTRENMPNTSVNQASTVTPARTESARSGGHVTNPGFIRPEENAHPAKLAKLYRTVEVFLVEHSIVSDWQIDLLCVYLDMDKKTAKVTRIENI